MQVVEIGPQSRCVQHKARSVLEGDLITFYCDQYPDFRLVINWRTGDIKDYHSGGDNICHIGMYMPVSNYSQKN